MSEETKTCYFCDGSGYEIAEYGDDWERITCHVCEGHGILPVPSSNAETAPLEARIAELEAALETIQTICTGYFIHQPNKVPQGIVNIEGIVSALLKKAGGNG